MTDLSRQRGMSLMETIITVFLIALILTAALVLLGQSAHVVTFLESKDNGCEAAEVGLDMMANEVRGALNITTPAPSVSGPPGATSLTFIKVDGSQMYGQRLPLTVPPVAPLESWWATPPWPPGGWPALHASFLITISYSIDAASGTLIRQTTPGTTSVVTSLPVAAGINGFGAYWQGSATPGPNFTGMLVLTLTVQQGEVVTPVTTYVVPQVYQN